MALNLPGPAALMRCRQLGATCTKVEPPAPRPSPPDPADAAGSRSGLGGDPMRQYSAVAYAALHQGMRVVVIDLKTEPGRRRLQAALARTDVLITSFRPSALEKLGLGWRALQAAHPTLSQVAIVGGPGAAAEAPGHDLTYMATAGLITGHGLPPTLHADLTGALQVTEAVLQLALCRRDGDTRGKHLEVALSKAASYLALPRAWGLTQPDGIVGGAHAGYGVYACRNGRVAVAALEPHFAQALCAAAGVAWAGAATMLRADTRRAIADYLRGRTRAQLDRLAAAKDIPLHTLPPAPEAPG